MIHRVLDATPCPDLATYRAAGGGTALATAAAWDPDAVIDLISAAGLRGRGGAGFPTGVKWRTVADAGSAVAATQVVINAAEGEPGTFKDRTLLRRNPYKVLEGGLVAAVTLGASEVVVATKVAFTREIRRLRRAIDEIAADPIVDGITVRLVLGPEAYLFGEETALLEVIENRQPFPRVAPPYRRGLDRHEVDPGRNASDLHLAAAGGSDEAPALVDNVETYANVVGIVANGAEWYRELGTHDSPGTVICTISGRTRTAGVGEYPMGTPLSTVIAELGGGAEPGHELRSAMSGVANNLLPADRFDTPLSYEGMAAAGFGLGAAGFLVFDDRDDPVAVAGGVAGFLAVESCGQCEPCKLDGLAIAGALDRMARSQATSKDPGLLDRRLETVTNGARCFLASQTQRTVASILALFPDAFASHARGTIPAAQPVTIAPLVDIFGGIATVDAEHVHKQPDWSYAAVDSGAMPAARYENTPLDIRPRSGAALPALPAEVAVDPMPLAQIRRAHARLDHVMAELDEHADDPLAARRLLEQMDRYLRDHLDVTERIVYPTLERAVPGLGDDAAWISDRSARDAEQQVERLLAQEAPPSAQELANLRVALHEHAAHDEHYVIPLLHNHLDASGLEELARAMADAAIDHPTNTPATSGRNQP